MNIDDVVAKWQGPIGDWAIRKGWLKQEADPENHGQLRNIPRNMLELLMLMVSELHELDQAVENEDTENTREEVADFAIRAIQMRFEYDIRHEIGLEADFMARACSAENCPHYAYVCEAVEVWRDKTLTDVEREERLWEHLVSGIVAIAEENAPEEVESGVGVLEWLDAAIEEKMAKNEKRPYMHGKRA